MIAMQGVRAAWLRGLLALLLFAVAAAQAAPSTKKGIGLSDRNAGARIAALNVAWYYTWSPRAITGVSGPEFVPMVWGGKKLDEQLGEIRRAPRPRHLLLINEPDKTRQSSMSVDEVRIAFSIITFPHVFATMLSTSRMGTPLRMSEASVRVNRARQILCAI